MGLSANDLVIVHLVYLLAFSISLLTFLRSELRWIVIYWLVSNVLSACSFVIVQYRGSDINFFTFTLPNLLNCLVGMLRVIALMQPFRWNQLQRWDLRLLYAGLAVIGLFVVTGFNSYSLILTLFCAALLCAAGVAAMVRSRLWRGVAGQKLMFASLLASALMFLWRAGHAYPFGEYTTFVGNEDETNRSLWVILIATFFMETSFLFLVFSRLQRNRALAERRTARIHGQRMMLRERNAEAERLATERLSMLNILTHEVRQPLNNAQAALQSVISEIVPASIQRDRLHGAALRTQAVLDDVSLSLSNAIVGATFMQRAERPDFQVCEILGIAELARTDCPAEEAGRIRLSTLEREIYLDVNPVLLRLALRNLLHNALKFSPAGSEVLIEVAHDSERFGVSFTVHNRLDKPRMVTLDTAQVEPQRRRVPTDGRHLGLIVVRETAHLHRGSLRVLQDQPDAIALELFIPA